MSANRRDRWLLAGAAVLAAAVHGAFLAGAIGPGRSLWLLAVLGLFALPGLPLARLLGLAPSWANAGWIALFGYGAASLAAVAVWAVAGLELAPVMAAAVALAALGTAVLKRRTPVRAVLEAAPLDARRGALVLAAAALAMALLAPPFLKIGAPIAGTRAFRAYFSGDYLKHVGVAAALARGELPPPSPYFLGTSLHYYWFFYVFPAAVHRAFGEAAPLLPQILLLSVLANGVFLAVLASFLARSARTAAGLAAGLGMAVLAYSYEGAYLLVRAVRLDQPLRRVVAEHNIDAVTRWYFGHPQIDGLFRSLMYTPQHLLGLALLLALVLIAGSGRRLGEWPTALAAAGTAAALFGFNSFIGLCALGWLGLLWLARIALGRPGRAALLGRGAAAAGLLGAAGLVYARLQMINTGGGFGVWGPLQTELPAVAAILLLNFGPILPLALAGGLAARRDRRELDGAVALLLALAFGLMGFFRIRSFESDVGLKVGLIADVGLLFFAVRGLEALARRSRVLAVGVLAALALPALPTPLMDVWNSSDIRNPGFTTTFTEPELAACRWLRTRTSPDSVVQSEPTIRTYSFLPTMAERPTAIADYMHARIFMVPDADYYARLEQVEGLFATPSAEEAVRIAHSLGIDLIYSEPAARALFPQGAAKFDELASVYDRDSVRIYRPELATVPYRPSPEELTLAPLPVSAEQVLPAAGPLRLPSGRPASFGLPAWLAVVPPGERLRIALRAEGGRATVVRDLAPGWWQRLDGRDGVFDVFLPRRAEAARLDLIGLPVDEAGQPAGAEVALAELRLEAFEEIPRLRTEPLAELGPGWYDLEKSPDGETWRWMSGRSMLSVENPFRDALLYLEFDLPLGPEAAVLLATLNQAAYVLPLRPGETNACLLRVPERLMGTQPRVVIELRASRTFLPAELGLGADGRVMGARLRRFWFE